MSVNINQPLHNDDMNLLKGKVLSGFIASCLSSSRAEFGDAFLSQNDVARFRKMLDISGLSDKNLASIIRDNGINHLNASVNLPNSTERVSLISFLMSEISIMDGDELPETQKALMERFSLQEQVSILKRSLPRPGIGLAVATADQMLLARISSIATSSQESMEAWVNDWIDQINTKRKRPSLLGMLKNFAVDKHPSTERGFFSLPVIMPYVAIIAPEKYGKAIEGRRPGTLYQMGSNDYSDFSYNSRDDFLRRNIINGLQVLEGKDLESFVLNEIGEDPIHDKNVGVCAALLASSPKWDRELIDMQALMSVRDRFYSFGAISSMISSHMLTAPSDWLEMAAKKVHCAELFRQVGQHDRFAKWLGRHVQSTQCGSLHYLRDLAGWIAIMDNESKAKTMNLLLHKFDNGIRTQSLYGSGIFYGKILVSTFPDDPYAEQAIREQVGYLVKRALIDGDMELLKATASKGWVTPDRIAECIWTYDEFKALTGEEGLPTELIRPFMPRNINRKLLSEDFGL